MLEPAPLFVLGLGPGSQSMLTPAALQALEQAQCLAGYNLYLDLVPQEIKAGKRLIASGMRHERDRCSGALDAAMNGETTALVCSGDPGIYAMASLVLELMEKENLAQIPLEIIPGVPAFCAAAAALGAPIGHDFACISLSDLLTPLELIFKRLEAALQADFVIVLYNPKSRGRPDHLARAMDLAVKYRDPQCPAAIVRNVCRHGQHAAVTSLSGFDYNQADMLSIVFIGNSQSRKWGKYMITPRGYASKRGKC